MKAAVVREPGRIHLTQVSRPTYGPYECLVEILNCSICSGTDRHIVDHQFPLKDYPCILGHESIGRVIECGERVTSFVPGDLVLRPTAVRPGEKLDGFGSLFGGFAEYGVVADAAAITKAQQEGADELPLPPFANAQQTVPSDFPPHLAGALITMKETTSFLDLLGVGPGATVAILGSGVVGLSFVMAAKILQASKVIVVGRRDEPLKRALELGADGVVNNRKENMRDAIMAQTEGRGVKFVVEAVGHWDLLNEARTLLASSGKIGVYGVPTSPSGVLNQRGGPDIWSIHFIFPYEERMHERVLQAFYNGQLNLNSLVSHRLPFEQIEEGMDLVRSRQAAKVSIDIKNA